MASKSTKGEILAKFFDDGEYTALFADGAVSAANADVCIMAEGAELFFTAPFTAARKWEDLPKEAQAYVEHLEKAVGCKITYISVGAEREAYIHRV